ncbi:MAG: hypothetical protein ACYC0J_06805, partial [Gammaproteobacteria bacterium]
HFVCEFTESIYNDTSAVCLKWIPAFAGMTIVARNDGSYHPGYIVIYFLVYADLSRCSPKLLSKSSLSVSN